MSRIVPSVILNSLLKTIRAPQPHFICWEYRCVYSQCSGLCIISLLRLLRPPRIYICTQTYIPTILRVVCMFIKLSKFPQVDLNFLRFFMLLYVCSCLYVYIFHTKKLLLLVGCPAVQLRTLMQVSLSGFLLVFKTHIAYTLRFCTN